MNLGQTIKGLRKRRGKNQTQFAFECDITQTYLSQIESGKKEPSLPMLRKIANHLDVPLPALVCLSLEVEDIPKEKRLVGKVVLKPAIDSFINEIFLT